MKLSNKILIGFLVFIFVYLTAAFAELRMTGRVNILTDKNSIAETVNIFGITHLVIDGIDQHVRVIGSDRTELEVRSISGNILAKLEYKISGDTLTLSDLTLGDVQTVKISVFIPKANLLGVTVNNAAATLKGLEPGMMTIVQKSANVWISECNVPTMNVSMSRSFLQISATHIDTLSTSAESSEMNVDTKVAVLKGSINEGSVLGLNDIGDLQLKKDASSRLRMHY
ncbi:MAG TPA: hypothetical protein VGD31_00625 [Sphingobacteriaceae bacterium]